LFAAGSVPAALFIAWENNLLYGSAVASGYGDLGPGFSLQHAAINIRHYSSWWLESQGPLAFLFIAALFRRRGVRRRDLFVLIGFGVSLVFLYLFYLPFEIWWFLRFLLPAVPLVFLLCADAVDWAARGSRSVRVAALTAFSVVAGSHAFRFLDTRDISGHRVNEERYVEPALYVAATTAPDAVILTRQHSGSLRYYSGRLTLRWDLLDPAWLDRAVDALHERGVPTYLLLEYWEEPPFRERFAGQSALTELALGPAATARGGELRFYPLKAPGAGARRSPIVIPLPSNRHCLDISREYVDPPAARRLR
jgi:hypothetical protein